MNRVDTKIGNRIKSAREAKKLTVEDIKKETGLDVNIPDNPELSIISGINTIYSDSKYDKVRYFPKEKEYK